MFEGMTAQARTMEQAWTLYSSHSIDTVVVFLIYHTLKKGHVAQANGLIFISFI
mgnify:CR=1 FL=1